MKITLSILAVFQNAWYLIIYLVYLRSSFLKVTAMEAVQLVFFERFVFTWSDWRLNLCRQRKYFLYKLSWGSWIDFADETLTGINLILRVILLVSIYWVSQTYRSSVLEILTRNSALYPFRSSSAWHIMIQTWLAKELCNNRNTVRYCFQSKSDFLLVCNSIHDTKFLHKRNSVLEQ